MEWNRIPINNIGYNLYKLIGIVTGFLVSSLDLGILTNIFFWILGTFFEKFYFGGLMTQGFRLLIHL